MFITGVIKEYSTETAPSGLSMLIMAQLLVIEAARKMTKVPKSRRTPKTTVRTRCPRITPRAACSDVGSAPGCNDVKTLRSFRHARPGGYYSCSKSEGGNEAWETAASSSADLTERQLDGGIGDRAGSAIDRNSGGGLKASHSLPRGRAKAAVNCELGVGAEFVERILDPLHVVVRVAGLPNFHR